MKISPLQVIKSHLVEMAKSPFIALLRRMRINRWIKYNKLHQHQLIFNELFKSIDGFTLSQQSRLASDAIEYTYGEIDFLSFIALLSLVPLDENSVFCDLGSGVGKAVIACAQVYPLKKYLGIEIFENLHHNALKIAQKLSIHPIYAQNASKIEFVHADFMEAELGEATCIFINSSTIINPTWAKLCSQLDSLPQVNTVISTSKPLNSKRFEQIKSTPIQMSWGTVLAFIHERKN